MQEVWILSGCRTAIGNFGGSLANIPVHELGCRVISESIKRAQIDSDIIEEIIMGHALQAGTKQGATRLASVKAGVPESSVAFSINNICGSGLKAINIAYALIKSNVNDIIVAGGMENMSQSPHIIRNIRFGNKLGDATIRDTILYDALTDAFEDYHMGITAENLAKQYSISRYQQDEYAVLSHNRVENAICNKYFVPEIVSVPINSHNGQYSFDTDEHFRANSSINKISTLPPVFCKNGSITVANSSGLGDGAASIVMASSKLIKKHSLKPLAKIICCVSVGVSHTIMGIGAAVAIEKILQKTGLKIQDIDLFEINEAFAAQLLAVKDYLNIDITKINISGGAIALGHPIGASGARILVTLIYNLLRMNGKYGIASICVGGGMGVSVLIEIS